MSTLDQRQAARTAWADFVAQVNARHDPRGGWCHVGQLPTLAPDDLALALTAYPDLLDDVQLHAVDLAQCLLIRGTPEQKVAAAQEYLADSVLAQLRRAIRQQLLSDLQDASEDQESLQASVEASRMGMTHDQYAALIRGDVR